VKNYLKNIEAFVSIRIMSAVFAVFVGLSTTWSDVAHGSDDHQATEESTTKATTKATTDVVIKEAVSAVTDRVRALGGRQGAFHVDAGQSGNNGQYSLGLNAGDSSSGMAIWFTPSYSDFENNGSTRTGMDYDGDLTTYLFGFDMVLSSELLVGGTLGYNEGDSKFKNNSKADSDGYIAAVYAVYNFPAITAYMNAGLINQDNDLDDYSTGALATGDFDSDTTFVNVGVMKSTELDGDKILTLDASYSYADTDTDSYTNSLLYRVKSQSSYISEIHVNTEIAQTISWGEYYGSVGTRLDLSNDEDYDNGDIGVDLGIGVRFNAADNLSGDIGIKKLFLQTDEKDVTVSANVRYEF